MNSKGLGLNGWVFRKGAHPEALQLLRTETRSPVNLPDLWISWFLRRVSVDSLEISVIQREVTLSALQREVTLSVTP